MLGSIGPPEPVFWPPPQPATQIARNKHHPRLMQVTRVLATLDASYGYSTRDDRLNDECLGVLY